LEVVDLRQYLLKIDIQWVRGFRFIPLLAILLLIGCGESTTISSFNPPDDHNISKNGYMHKSGYSDPLNNCAECHGDDLQGGTVAVSCYACHGEKW